MSVYKHAQSPYWHYDFQYQGRRFHGSTGVTTERKAQAIERQRRQEAAEGRLGDLSGLTLDQAAGLWWTQTGRHLKTADDCERRLETMLRIMGKSIRITDIKTRHVAAAVEKRRSESFTRSNLGAAMRYAVANATVNRDIIDMLRRVLSRAAKVWEVKGLQTINWTDLRLTEPPAKVRYYTRDEQAAWLAQCDASTRVPLRILLTYGLRLGELFFPPEAFDPGTPEDGPRLTLNKRKKDVHLLPLRPDDARQIAARVSQAKSAKLDTIWFERGAGGKLIPMTYYGLQARLRSAAHRAGLKGGAHVHGARHHAGTIILSESKNLKTAQQLLGHKDISSTMRYAHAMTDDLRAALEGQSRNSPEPDLPKGDFLAPKQRRRQ